MTQITYDLPPFLFGTVDIATYRKWLTRKTQAHLKRDRARGNTAETYSSYKQAIQRAVMASGAKDAYTNEVLDWTLIGKYNNEESSKYRRDYRRRFALLPTIDHVGDGSGEPNFKICGWRTNDVKNDLTLEELLEFAHLLIAENQD
jgi:hypothetical protein